MEYNYGNYLLLRTWATATATEVVVLLYSTLFIFNDNDATDDDQ